MAEKPSMITRSFKKGSPTTVPGVPATVFFASSFEKITNNKKQMLQIKVNLEKNETIFIKINVLKNSQQNNINLSELYFFEWQMY